MLSTPASHFYQHQIKRHPPCHLGNTISAATHHGDITTPIVTEIPTTEPYINTINPPRWYDHHPLAPRNETAGP